MNSLVMAASALAFCAILPAQEAASQDAPRIRIETQGANRAVFIGDEPFTVYRTGDRPLQPLLYPVLGPGGKEMMRHYPFRDGVENEAKDHPHHRSLWFTHGSVNGHDFWHGKQNVVELVEFVDVPGAPDVIKTKNRWRAGDEVICTDTRTLRFGVEGDMRWIDYRIDIHATEGPVLFGDTKEGSMAFRMAPTLRLRGKVAEGEVVNSEGIEGRRTWGKRAAWVAYWGPVDDAKVGFAMFDHPTNPRHPTWWHARDYGLVGANPFGIHDFEGKPKGTGDLEVEKGATLTLRYRICFFSGDPESAGVAQHYATWAGRKAGQKEGTKR